MNTADSLMEDFTQALDNVDWNKDRLNLVARPGVDFSRNSRLPLKDIMKALVAMSGGSLAKELEECGLFVRPSAFVEARKKINVQAFRELFAAFQFFTFGLDRKGFLGYRVLAVDGSTINLPRHPGADSYIQNKGHPEGINQLHLNALYDICNNTYFDALIQPEPKMNEVQALIDMIEARPLFMEKTLIIGDRGYESYNLFAHVMRKENLDFLIRVKNNRTAMRPIQRLPMTELDVDVTFTICTTQRNEDKERGHIFIQTRPNSERAYSPKTHAGRWDFESPCPMSFRVVRFLLPSGEYETLVTSLPRFIRLEQIKELYHKRWGIETSFRNLKYALGLINLHGKSDQFAGQEVYAQLTAYNFCSRVCAGIPIQQKAGSCYEYKVNFKEAVARCREFLKRGDMTGAELMERISRHTIPIRPGRADQRKLHPKGFVGFTYRVAA